MPEFDASTTDHDLLVSIANSLEFVETNPTPSKAEILERLQRGEITAEDAIREMEAL